MVEEIKLVIPMKNIDKLHEFMRLNEIRNNAYYRLSTVTVFISDNKVTLKIRHDQMEEEKKILISNFIKDVDVKNSQFVIIDESGNKKNVEDLLTLEFDKILADISKNEFLNIIVRENPSDIRNYFRKIIEGKFKEKEFFTKEAGAEFSPKTGELVNAGNLMVNDNCESYGYFCGTVFEETIDLFNSLEQLSETYFSNYSINEILKIALINYEMDHVVERAITLYCKDARNRLDNMTLNNVKNIYLSDIYYHLNKNTRTKLAEEIDYPKMGDTMLKFYNLCKKYCVNEDNFKNNVSAFYSMIDFEINFDDSIRDELGRILLPGDN